ncbi:MAG: hypothetical protein GY903_01185 [Fuerstiella sp.]|nr:hypothetical protein [Fuerstiella sp.]MCP4853092.1 hypothetical protein [Fuerstiella sp.]
MTDDDHKKKIADAKCRVQAMDKVDGFDDRSIGVILTALNTGLKNKDGPPLYDALYMLQDVAEELTACPEMNVMSLKGILRAVGQIVNSKLDGQ